MTRSIKHQTQWFRWLILMAVILPSLFGLPGCDSEATPIPTLEPTSTPASVPIGASVPTRIQVRRQLVVGIRYDLPPFGYVTEEGTLAGFDVDFSRELARR